MPFADNPRLDGVLMNRIRVLIANRPRLMRELIMATISDQPDIDIVAELQDYSAIEAAIETTNPDCVIVALDESDHLPLECYPVMRRHTQVNIIAVAPKHDAVFFYWSSFEIRSKRIEPSMEAVLRALRGDVQPIPGTISNREKN